jgi:hypothetical protein
LHLDGRLSRTSVQVTKSELVGKLYNYGSCACKKFQQIRMHPRVRNAGCISALFSQRTRKRRNWFSQAKVRSTTQRHLPKPLPCSVLRIKYSKVGAVFYIDTDSLMGKELKPETRYEEEPRAAQASRNSSNSPVVGAYRALL